MHQCKKCGTEFEGNFCPKCGKRYEENNVCPKCGNAVPDGAVFCNSCGYKFKEDKSGKWKEKVQKVGGFLAKHKKPFIAGGVGVAALVVVLVLVFAVIVPAATNIFKASKTDKAQLTDTRADVVGRFGEPNEQEGSRMVWYEKSFADLQRQMKDLEVKEEKATSFSELEKYAEEELVLTEKMDKLVYKRIEASFSGSQRTDTLYRLFFDSCYSEDTKYDKKDVSSVRFSPENLYYFGSVDNLGAKIYYIDGSFQLCRVPSSVLSSVDTTQPGDYEIKWSDTYGEYTGTVTVLQEVDPSATSVVLHAYSDISQDALKNFATITVLSGKIPYGAFQDFDNLQTVVLGDEVTSIGERAFFGCVNLTSIAVDENNPSFQSIDGSLYSKDGKTLVQYAIGKKDASFTIPDEVTSIGSAAFSGCISLTSIEVAEDNTAYKSIDGNLYNKDGKTLLQYAVGKTATSFIISDEVTDIAIGAFFYCKNLTNITIPDTVTSIGVGAFNRERDTPKTILNKSKQHQTIA